MADLYIEGLEELTIRLEKDPSGGWFVKVEELPGCMSQGGTVAEALENIQEAAELWLEVDAEKVTSELIPVIIPDLEGEWVLIANLAKHLDVNPSTAWLRYVNAYQNEQGFVPVAITNHGDCGETLLVGVRSNGQTRYGNFITGSHRKFVRLVGRMYIPADAANAIS